MAGMKVCWFSTGISSFIACYLAKDVDEIIYTHVSNQHPDSIRFLHDCERLLGRKITILQSERQYVMTPKFVGSWIYLYTMNWKLTMVTGITAYKLEVII